MPERFIRAYQLRDPETGRSGPWLAGMTLDPGVVYEAWCHQRGYVCMIEEFGGRPIKAGDSFSAAFIVGYFDSIDEMHAVYDRYRGATTLSLTAAGWKLEPAGSKSGRRPEPAGFVGRAVSQGIRRCVTGPRANTAESWHKRSVKITRNIRPASSPILGRRTG